MLNKIKSSLQQHLSFFSLPFSGRKRSNYESNSNAYEEYTGDASKQTLEHSKHVLGYHRNYLGYPTKKIQIFFYTLFLICIILLIIKLMSPENLQNLTR